MFHVCVWALFRLSDSKDPIPGSNWVAQLGDPIGDR